MIMEHNAVQKVAFGGSADLPAELPDRIIMWPDNMHDEAVLEAFRIVLQPDDAVPADESGIELSHEDAQPVPAEVVHESSTAEDSA